jgi:hypothetical protein
MEIYTAVLAGFVIGLSTYGLISVLSSLNELRTIVENISASTEKIKAVSARIEKNHG